MMAHESHLAEFSSSGHHPAMQGFDPPGHELFSLQAGMEMLGFPSKQQREFLPGDFSQIHDKNMMVATETSAISPWQVDDAASRPLFPSTGGLSLSLSNARASNTYGFPQSFQQNDIRDGLLSRAPNSHQEHLLMQEGRGFYSQQYTYQLKNSKYLIPVQELLSELCSLGRGESSSKTHKGNQVGSSSSSSWNQSLSSMNILELQKRKADLFTMLTEVDKRYRKYCQQMKAVVSSFEAVAGGGAAAIYSKLASRAMSRHFRCLRDAITGQIRETKNVLGVKDTGATGATRGETPRLKLLDQCLRQQRAFQQTGMTESHPWRPQRGLPERAVSILRAWLFEHFLHPYPSDVDKHILARQTGLSRSQVSNWFINARVRLWKPMIEEMYSEETKDQDNHSGHQGSTNKNPNPNSNPVLDKKPTPPQLSANCDSLSSIVNSGSKNIHSVPRADNFSAVADMDFSSYRTTYGDQNLGSGFLSLGLQQHGGGGMSLSYAPPTQNSFLVSGEHLDSSQPTQFSILDGEEQTLPYRNLMGVQLLHDLAG